MSEITRDMGDKEGEQWNWQNTCNCKCRNLWGKLVYGKLQMGRGLKAEVLKTVQRVGVLCACEAAPPSKKKEKREKKEKENERSLSTSHLLHQWNLSIQTSLLHAYWTSDTNTGLSAACLLDQRYQHKLLCCVPIRPVILTNTSLTKTSLSAACLLDQWYSPIQASPLRASVKPGLQTHLKLPIIFWHRPLVHMPVVRHSS